MLCWADRRRPGPRASTAGPFRWAAGAVGRLLRGGLAAAAALAAVPAAAAPQAPDPADAVPVAEVRADDDGDGEPDMAGDTVTVAGRAVIGSGVLHSERLEVPLQDGERGIYLFDWEIGQPVEAGDSVVARGVVGSFAGRVQLQEPDYRVVQGPGRLPDPARLEISGRRLERRESTLVELEGEIVRTTRNAGGRLLVLRGFADPGEVVSVFLPWDRVPAFDLDRFQEGERVAVTGVAGQYDMDSPANELYQVYPLGPESLQTAGLTAEVYRKLAWAGGAALLLGFLVWGVLLQRQTTKRKEAQQRYESLFDENAAGVAALDPDGRVVRTNPAFRELTGVAPGELEEVPFTSFVPEAARQEVSEHLEAALQGASSSFETVLEDGDGTRLQVDVSAVPIMVDGEARGVYVITEDITPRKEFEQRLEHQALHDYLTGLPNRALFTDRLEHAAERAGRDGSRLAVLFLDLDRFKRINDTAGHAVGDRLLQVVAERLRGVARDADTLARFGGDEFAFLLEDVEGTGEARHVARRIQEVMDAPVSLDGRSVRVSASVGIAATEPGERNAGDVLQRADQAMYRAKADGGACSRLYREDDADDAGDGFRMEGELRRALEEDELFVEYQPLVCLETGGVVGLEALVRWDHPRRGRLEPGGFLPLAERSGLAAEVDRWVLRRACRETAAWQRRHPDVGRLLLSVNLSARYFAEPGIADDLDEVLRAAHGHDGEVQMEIAESTAASEPEQVRALKSLGVRLAIDDFGTGYSALGYLRDLEVDCLKLHRSFVQRVDSDVASSAIARTVITLGRALDVQVVADGIETEAQLRTVGEFGCDLGQGLLLGGPQRIQELEVDRVSERATPAVS